MERSIRLFFTALLMRFQGEPELSRRLKIHFVGTAYANGSRARKTVEPIANEFGLSEIVEERTDRLPFLTTLKLLADADALLIFGSDDPAYTASKLFPCILARKPLLAIVHEKSSVAEIMRKTRAGTLVTFNGDESSREPVARIQSQWLERRPADPDTDWNEFERYTARSMTASLCSVFADSISAAPISARVNDQSSADSLATLRS